MIAINAYSKEKVKGIMKRNGEPDKYVHKFSTEFNYYVDWFAENEEDLRPKFEYFYGPYLNNM
jgi:hypothetical protein